MRIEHAPHSARGALPVQAAPLGSGPRQTFPLLSSGYRYDVVDWGITRCEPARVPAPFGASRRSARGRLLGARRKRGMESHAHPSHARSEPAFSVGQARQCA